MPETINIDGQDKILYTQEEVAQQLAEKDISITDLQEKIKGFEGKDLNFGKLRDIKEKIESDLTKALSEKDALQKQIQESITQQQVKERQAIIDSEIKKLVGDDKEMADKVEFQFKRLKGEEVKNEEIAKIISDAYLLANPQSADALKNIGGGQGPIVTTNKSTQGVISPELVPLANKMGITNEDINKYGTRN